MPGPAKVSLLIADDDARICALIEAAAERAGGFGPVRCATDGEAALHVLHTLGPADYPDLIVTDLSMPRMNGIELIRALKQDSALRSIPVAILTSSDVPNDREDALAAGACGFFTKPLGLDALTNLLRSLRESCGAAVHV